MRCTSVNAASTRSPCQSSYLVTHAHFGTTINLSSSAIQACPTSDLSILEIADDISCIQGILAASTDNCAVLDNSTDACSAQYGFSDYGTKVYNPLSLPTGILGTDPLSNAPGNAFTDPGTLPSTLSLWPGYDVTISLAQFNSDAAAVTAVATTAATDATPTETVTSGSAGQTGKGTSTKKGASSSTTTGSVVASSTANSRCSRTGNPWINVLLQNSFFILAMVFTMV
jgi:hypothetical protein